MHVSFNTVLIALTSVSVGLHSVIAAPAPGVSIIGVRQNADATADSSGNNSSNVTDILSSVAPPADAINEDTVVLQTSVLAFTFAFGQLGEALISLNASLNSNGSDGTSVDFAKKRVTFNFEGVLDFAEALQNNITTLISDVNNLGTVLENIGIPISSDDDSGDNDDNDDDAN